MNERYFKIIRYLISGGTAAAISIGLLFVFTHYAHIWYLTSSILSYTIAFLVSFTLQKFWTFRNTSLELWRRQISIYFVIFLANVFLNTLIVYCFVEYGGVHYLTSQIIAAGLIAIASFFLYKHLVFKSPSVQESTAEALSIIP